MIGRSIGTAKYQRVPRAIGATFAISGTVALILSAMALRSCMMALINGSGNFSRNLPAAF